MEGERNGRKKRKKDVNAHVQPDKETRWNREATTKEKKRKAHFKTFKRKEGRHAQNVNIKAIYAE